MQDDFDIASEMARLPWAMEIPGSLLMKGGPQDYIGAALCIRGTLYFKDAHTKGVREELCKCFNEFLKLAGDSLVWLWREDPPEGKNLIPYGKVKPLPDMMNKMDEDDHLSFYYTSGGKPEDASPWLFSIYGQRGWKAKMGDNLSVLEFSVPIIFFEQHRIDFIRLFVSSARFLRAEQGYAGYALNLSVTKRDNNEPTEAFMSEQMPGLDVGTAALLANRPEFKGSKIKTVSWLTVIHESRLVQIGNLAFLHRNLPSSHFAIYDYEVGYVVQAGASPSLIGDSEHPAPATYVLVDHLLSCLRYETVGSLHGGSHDGEIRLTGWSADQWLKRFDISPFGLRDLRNRISTVQPLTANDVLDNRLT